MTTIPDIGYSELSVQSGRGGPDDIDVCYCEDLDRNEADCDGECVDDMHRLWAEHRADDILDERADRGVDW